MLTMSLGIDVAKDKLDIALYQAGNYKQALFSNDKDGWQRLAVSYETRDLFAVARISSRAPHAVLPDTKIRVPPHGWRAVD